MQITVMTLNCKGLRRFSKQLKVIDLVKNHQVDVLFLQETHFVTISDATQMANLINYKVVLSNYTSTLNGVLVMYKPTILNAFSQVSFEVDFEGRFAALKLRSLNLELLICTVYAPTDYTDRNTYLKNLPSFLSSSTAIVIGGDWNFSMISGKKENNVGKLAFEPTMKALDLFDVATSNDSHLKSTFFGSNNSQSKIDRIYVTKGLVTVHDCVVQARPADFTDHCFVLTKLQFNDVPTRGPSYWKLNPALFSDENYVESFQTKMGSFGNINYENWDLFKSMCKTEFRQQNKLRLSLLNCHLQAARRTIFAHFEDKPLVNELVKAYSELKCAKLSRKMKPTGSSTLEYRLNEIALHEKCETKRKMNDRVIESVLSPDGTTLRTSLPEICRSIFDYYS